MATETHDNLDTHADVSRDVAAIMGGLYGDGIIALKGAFSREWVAGAARGHRPRCSRRRSRGPAARSGAGRSATTSRSTPSGMRGFVDLVTHPWVVAVCEAVLGPDYQIVEIGFDVPVRARCTSRGTATSRRRTRRSSDAASTRSRSTSRPWTSAEDMGPFEIAPGTQWDEPDGFEHGMFPPKSLYPRYEARAQRKLPKMGDISARSALTIHRGTPNRSRQPRPVLVLGVDAPDARNAERHDLQFTRRVLRRAAARRCSATSPAASSTARADRAGAHDRGPHDGW